MFIEGSFLLLINFVDYIDESIGEYSKEKIYKKTFLHYILFICSWL